MRFYSPIGFQIAQILKTNLYINIGLKRRIKQNQKNYFLMMNFKEMFQKKWQQL